MIFRIHSIEHAISIHFTINDRGGIKTIITKSLKIESNRTQNRNSEWINTKHKLNLSKNNNKEMKTHVHKMENQMQNET